MYSVPSPHICFLQNNSYRIVSREKMRRGGYQSDVNITVSKPLQTFSICCLKTQVAILTALHSNPAHNSFLPQAQKPASSLTRVAIHVVHRFCICVAEIPHGFVEMDIDSPGGKLWPGHVSTCFNNPRKKHSLGKRTHTKKQKKQQICIYFYNQAFSCFHTCI